MCLGKRPIAYALLYNDLNGRLRPTNSSFLSKFHMLVHKNPNIILYGAKKRYKQFKNPVKFLK